MMSCRNRYGVSDDAELSKDGGVVEKSENVQTTNDDADREDNINIQSVEAKPRDVHLIAAEISTIDAISAGIKLPVNGVDDLSDTTSVSDDTPPSTPSSLGSSGRQRSRRRKLSLQDSHVSSSSSPARGLPNLLFFVLRTCTFFMQWLEYFLQFFCFCLDSYFGKS